MISTFGFRPENEQIGRLVPKLSLTSTISFELKADSFCNNILVYPARPPMLYEDNVDVSFCSLEAISAYPDPIINDVSFQVAVNWGSYSKSNNASSLILEEAFILSLIRNTIIDFSCNEFNLDINYPAHKDFLLQNFQLDVLVWADYSLPLNPLRILYLDGQPPVPAMGQSSYLERLSFFRRAFEDIMVDDLYSIMIPTVYEPSDKFEVLVAMEQLKEDFPFVSYIVNNQIDDKYSSTYLRCTEIK